MDCLSNFVPTTVEGLRSKPSALLETGTAHEFVPGDQCDRYELVYPVARGGMANVWLARLRGKHGFERMVALKTILPSFAQDPRFRNMFLDEARIASRIEHANVAQIFDLGEQDENLYLVMEWVDGDSLANLWRASQDAPGGLPLPILLRILADACAGLHAAHELCDERGRALDVVHRDVSPQNILVSSTGVVKVIDFGVAKARGRIAEETSTGTVKGKLHYMAPERALGTFVDRRADVWAIGAVLYRLLAGRPAYDGADDRSVIKRLITRVRPHPLPRSVPRSVVNIVTRALAPEPSHRYPTAAHLQRDLEAALHEFGAPTTSHDVAAFVSSRLGVSLSRRRSAINTAIERLDQSATLRCAAVVNQSSGEISVPEVAARQSKTAPPARFALALPPVPSLPLPSRLPQIAEAEPVLPAPVTLDELPALRPRFTALAACVLGACALCLVGIVALLGQHLSVQPERIANANPIAATAPPRAALATSRTVPVEVMPTTDPCLPSPVAIDVADLAVEHGRPRTVRARFSKMREKLTVSHAPAAPAHAKLATKPRVAPPVHAKVAAEVAPPPLPTPPPPRLASTAPAYESLGASAPAPKAKRASVDDGF